MAKRKIINIDENICNGCGDCIPNCPEGALQIIDGKARLVSDLFCDGLGACIGHCPLGAIKIEEREAEEYDERKVMENIIKQGPNVIKAHLSHLKEHGADDYYEQAIKVLDEKGIKPASPSTVKSVAQWPIQLTLLSPNAPFFKGSDLIVCADCVAFTLREFDKYKEGKIIAIGCPKLDQADEYIDKLAGIFANDIKSIEVAMMEVPCCSGLLQIVKAAMAKSGKDLPIKTTIIKIDGEQKF